MAVEAMVAVVIQKLTDALKEESVIHNKVIAHQLHEIEKSLKKMRGYLMEAEDMPENKQSAKQWAGRYLGTLYYVEDEIEKFTLRIARQRERSCFLMNHALFFNNLNACRKLRRKMKKMRAEINKLNEAKPREVEDASLRTILSSESSLGDDQQPSYRNNSIPSLDLETNTNCSDNPSDNVNDDDDTNGLQAQVPSTISETHEVLSPRNANVTVVQPQSTLSPISEERVQPLQKKVTFRYFKDQKEKLIVGFREHSKQMSSFSYREEELGIFGIGEDVDTLVKRLTKEDERFVSIIGEVGSGKTTLARAVYRSKDIKERFNLRSWISLLPEYSAADILLSISKAVDDSKGKGTLNADPPALKMRLFERLTEKSYLLVLDGVRTCGVWEDLKDVFPDEKNGSKIIFTSCESTESSETCFDPHCLKPLSEEDSWNMFLKKAGKEKDGDLIPDDLKERILELCNGLPLNIVLIAGLLSAKNMSIWLSKLSFGQNLDDVLSLCYNDLKAHTKLCLLHLVLFPKEVDIPVRRLLRLWLAEGFVKRSSAFPEDLVQKYFQDLVNRSMIQVTKLRSDNGPKKCRLLSILHPYLLPKARDISLFYVHRGLADHESLAGPFGVRRMVECVDIQNFSFKPSFLRSYLSFNFQKKDMPAIEVGRFLSRIVDGRFGLLRVLDLEGVYKPSLPEKLGILYHLRYLGLRWTFLDCLPQSVGELPYLETLDVKHTNIDSLPESIWKLKHLRHLNLNNMHLALRQSSCLTLLTLWGLLVDEKTSVKNGLDKLFDLRELGITFNLKTSKQNDLIDWIAKLSTLQSLRLRSKDDSGHPSTLLLKPLPKLDQLSHLNLLGILEKLPELHEFPPTLKVLTLSVSQLKADPMRTLGQLPCLTVLRLLASSYLGKEMFCHRGGFAKLRVLKLWMLEELEKWDVEEGAMQRLKELDIRCCHKLHNIPTSLLHRKCNALEELILTGMPDAFTTDVKASKSKDTSLTVIEWRTTPLPLEQGPNPERGNGIGTR